MHLLIAFLAVGALAQSGLRATDASSVTPETAFLSPSKYTNAFFGFTLPLPKDSPLRESTRSFKANNSLHILFGLQGVTASSTAFRVRPKTTIFIVTARQSKNASAEEVSKAASGATGQSAKEIEIGGKTFWEMESQTKAPEGKTWSVCFATAIDGYILQFTIESFDDKLTKQLQHGVEAISFFDPSRAEDMAGPDSQIFYPGASHSSR
jgi:hypothetical protein